MSRDPRRLGFYKCEKHEEKAFVKGKMRPILYTICLTATQTLIISGPSMVGVGDPAGSLWHVDISAH